MYYYVAPGLIDPEVLYQNYAAMAVLQVTGVSLKQLQEKTRKREVVVARQLFVNLMTEKAGVPKSRVARVVYGTRPSGNLRNHDNPYRNAVYHLIKEHSNLCETNPLYQSITKQAHQIYDDFSSGIRPVNPK